MTHLRQLFLSHVAQTSPMPLALDIVKGKGIYLFSRKGQAYVDLISGIGVSALGHNHPKVVQAVKKQADQYLHAMVYGEYVLAPQVQLAKAITEALPKKLNSVYFVNSGSEAVEGAMKLAKKYTGRYEIIAAKNAYHGSTQGAASLMNPPVFNHGYYPLLPGIKHINYGQITDLELITESTACVIIEPIQGEGGIIVPTKSYLRALRKRCKEVGALLVFDEIQTGYGRTGHFFAFQGFGVTPDILLTAKGMGGGMPIGAFIASKKIMKVLAQNPILGHITTFGGHPVSAAAGLATIKTLLKGKLLEQVEEKGALFRKLLVHPEIVEIRGKGLMMAVEMRSSEKMFDVVDKCIQNGVITDWFLFDEKSFRIAPPLIIAKGEIRKVCKILLAAME
ncbi:MAG TPA: aspartate aminotransferase family protein [Saprospiraceae bacterium]|nr:aspartate aminotransferase family protein [Saprospiraceae bacterium]